MSFKIVTCMNQKYESDLKHYQVNHHDAESEEG